MTKTSDFCSFRHGEDKNEAQIRPVQTIPSKGVLAADEVEFVFSSIPLIMTSDGVVLIDGGARERKSENTVLVEASLGRIFVRSSDATLIVITLANRCHIWGLVRGVGSLRYENALYLKFSAEWAFWMDDINEPATDYERPMRSITGKVLPATLCRIPLLDDGDENLTGLRDRASGRHRSSHTLMVFQSDVVSFMHPDWSFVFDLHAKQAGRTRRLLLDQADDERANLHGFHWLYPGAGTTERSKTAFRLRPIAEAV